MQTIKRRIDSVGTTRQIAQAMQMVANTKITHAREAAVPGAPFYEEFRKLLRRIASSAYLPDCPFFSGKQIIYKKLYIVVGSDRGLCGAYNVNVGKGAREAMDKGFGDFAIVTVGSKIEEHFRKEKAQIIRKYSGISEKPFYEDAMDVGGFVFDLFMQNEVQEIYLVYTHFVSMLQYDVRVIPLLPLAPDFQEEAPKEGPAALMQVEPDEETMMQFLVPRYINASIYNALIQGAACEQASRVTSMDAAVKNSAELIESLQIEYNMARQAEITQDINEIVGSSEALRV